MNLFVYFINNIHVTVSILYNEIQYIHQIHEINLPLIAFKIFTYKIVLGVTQCKTSIYNLERISNFLNYYSERMSYGLHYY